MIGFGLHPQIAQSLTQASIEVPAFYCILFRHHDQIRAAKLQILLDKRMMIGKALGLESWHHKRILRTIGLLL
jgi:hypothetical protein